ncbi:ParB/RepB/Spo0J family partition protein [Acidisoma silvae]|uniref:ParB/RepB/Spo0J family partition protein n=1 Tax=Acidisoma silvae TaxID=2802396 RepID=A0A963YYC9_9PROT|nr:ParB/RepB/Spo0J family partition protein [Acidisoma silvae]MCB8878510.1 ParB/RepB/Spo0J family partition protein [Acidisoma silvae]
MSGMKRKGPSRLMESMQNRVEELGDSFISSGSELKHSFEVKLDHVEPDETQARKKFDQAPLNELAASLKEHGQLVPILVRAHPERRGHWIIVAGERRWRAAKLAGLPVLLAIERASDVEVVSLLENLQREDLTPLEESAAIVALMEKKNWGQREISKQLGRSLSDVNGLIKIRTMPDAFLKAVLTSENPVSRNLLIELSRLPESNIRDRLCNEALRGELTIGKLRQAAQEVPKDGQSGKTKRVTQKESLSGKQIRAFSERVKSLAFDEIKPNERRELQNLAEWIRQHIK